MVSYTPLMDINLYADNSKDISLITKQLEVIRLKISEILDLPSGVEIDLLSLKSQHGQSFPCLAINCNTSYLPEALPEIEEVEALINQWIVQNKEKIDYLSSIISLN